MDILIVQIVIGMMFNILGARFLHHYLLCVFKKKDLVNWVVTYGRIDNCEHVQILNGDVPDYYPKITYSYNIEEVKYTSNQIFHGTFDFSQVDYLQKYAKDQEVQVLYNPKRHKEAVLEVVSYSNLNAYLICSFVLFFIGICFVYFTIFPIKDPSFLY